LKQLTRIATVLVLAAITALPTLAQNSRIYRDGNSWVEEITGSLPQSRNLKVTTDIGTVQVTGGNDNEIHFTIRKRCYGSNEETARHSFQQFEVTAVNGATSPSSKAVGMADAPASLVPNSFSPFRAT
jgi:hypothetical protein